MLAKMRPDRLKMHQKAFGGRALPGPAGGAYSTPPDLLAAKRGPTSKGRGGREGIWIGRGYEWEGKGEREERGRE